MSMSNAKTGKREFAPDLIRVTGLLLILGIHFYYNNGFYSQPQTDFNMYLADFGRWLTFICVPLFVMLTGYLKCDALPDKKYYRSVSGVVITWLFLSLVTIPFKIFYLRETHTFWGWIEQIFSYSAAQYSWYIEMFIGLSLLAPFMNFIFKAEEKYQKIALITISGLSFLPSFLNGIRIDGATIDLIPNYITGLWPLAYYMLGGYIRKHEIKAGRIIPAFILILCPAVKALLTFITANGQIFNKGIGGGYSDIAVAVTTVSVFLLLYKVETKSLTLRKIMAHISKRSLIIYLMSYVSDQIMQPILQPYIKPDTYVYMFFVWVIVIFIMTLLISELLYPVILLFTGKLYQKKA